MPQKYRFFFLGLSALISIYFYYIYYPIHNEGKTHFLIYFLIIAFLYGAYKLFQNFLGEAKLHFTPLHILQVFFFQLLLICGFFTTISGGGIFLGSVVFLKILLFLIFTACIWLIIYGVGGQIVRYFHYFHIEDSGFRIFAQLGLGFGLSMFGVFLLAALGQYNATTLIGLGVIYTIIAVPDIKRCIGKIKKPIVEYHISSSRSSLKLMIDELHVILITFLLGVNFLSVYRPFPIGWDDLGVYMNYPKLLAEAGSLAAFGKMYLWELYTSMGHVLGNQTFAFFLNSFSGVIVALVTFIALKHLYPQGKNALFSVPLLGTLILLMMPMAVFQLAKDMKLDYGLLAFSTMSLYMLYSLFFTEGKFSHKKSFEALLVVGILIGITFAIKITSLLLLLGCLGAISYKKFSLYGFFGFLCVFFGIFTLAGLWKIMNVIFPSDNELLIATFSSLSTSLGMLLFVIGIISKKKGVQPLKNFLLESGALLLGFILALTPWLIKNSFEVPQGVSAKAYIGGVAETYRADYELIYTAEELQAKEESIQKLGLSASGVTSNEDFGRYFGYEEGINNYMKLPWNLTFQVNQKGEFTDITYIFFALLPIVFLFLPYRKEKYKYPIILGYILCLLYFIPGIKIPLGMDEGVMIYAHLLNPISLIGTQFFASFTLPLGYSIILAGILLPFVYLHYTLKESKLRSIFLINYSFTCLYGFLWAISSFGVVWYAIVLYFTLLVMISLCIIAAEEEDSAHSRIGGYMILGIVWIYVFYSAMPHGVTNIAHAGYSQYKIGAQSQEEALIIAHREYFPILFALNIAKENQQEMFIDYKTRLLEIVDDVPDSEELIATLAKVPDIESLNGTMNQLLQIDFGELDTGKQVGALRQSLYEDIILPPENIRSKKNIFRVGTFLKYFISENNLRLFDDSLLENFSKYIYDKDASVTKERMKKLGLEYILLDLNAATIDQAEEKQLTNRYENMLTFLVEADLRLIESDSVCLNTGLDIYKKDKDISKYLTIAGVNYGKRAEKGVVCLQEIVTILQTEEITPDNKAYLLPYKNVLQKQEVPLSETVQVQKTLAPYVNGGYKALFELED